MKLTSDFALLDVKEGREKLEEHFKDRPLIGECPPALRIPVVITGYIGNAYGDDDGTSQVFNVTVTGLSVGKP